MVFSVRTRPAESSLREYGSGRKGQNAAMATDELLDEREANALFELLEHRLPSAGADDRDAEDAPR
jgi:hypothetical protein